MNEITINGEVFVKKSEIEKQETEKLNGMEYCIIRTHSAGVWAGYVAEQAGTEIVLIKARRLWKWVGAFTLSELSKYGAAQPDDCKFATEVEKVKLTQGIEVIPCTNKAKNMIHGVQDYEY